MRPAVIISAEAVRRHLLEELLPLWRDHGLDRSCGGFFGRLDPQLSPRDDFKRLVVQARQLYAFSQARLLGAGSWTLEAAAQGLAFMQDHFWDTQWGGWYYLTTLAGEPLDPRKDTYAHAFVLFSLAAYHRASGEREPLDWAERTLDRLEEQLAERVHGGFFEAASERWEPIPETRRQNPHMHLLEAFLALYEATGEPRYRELARDMVELFQRHFFDSSRGCLGEFFTDDWKPAPGRQGRIVEPGHHFEWVWLLHEYARLTQDESVLRHAERLFEFARSHGVDGEQGLAFDEIDHDGVVRRDTKRVWPQTEYVKALAVTGELTEMKRVLGLCFSSYVDPGHHGWNDQLTRDGRVFSEDMPATTIYHITLALSEVIRVLEA